MTVPLEEPFEPGPPLDPEAVLRLLDQVPTFHYVTAPQTPTYRAIVTVLYEAKQRYSVGLRVSEIFEGLLQGSYYHAVTDEKMLDERLSALVDWGNLSCTRDNRAVSRLEDFYHRQNVYHLTTSGDAAHRAVGEVEATVGRSGSLQSGLLVKVGTVLTALLEAALSPRPDPEALVVLLFDLHAAFETLTQEANLFIGELARYEDSETSDEEGFAHRKLAILAYITRFVETLRQLEAEIGSNLRAVASHGERLIDLAATSADLPPSLGGEDPRQRWVEQQRARLDGICAWFIGEPTPTVKRLAGVAVGAVVGLTRALGRLNDRRSRRVDRAADFRTLARWFVDCATDADAHRLAHAAFGLGSARHFHLAEEDEEHTNPGTSWWNASPVEVPVRLRTRGQATHTGRTAPMADYRAAKEFVERERARERLQLEAAVRRFADRGPLRLSQVATLDENEFDLLLELLDEALSAEEQDGARRAVTADGRLEVALALPAGEAPRVATLVTPRGELRCRDYEVTVTDTLAAQSAA